MAFDLSSIPCVDNHCHGIYQEQEPSDLYDWRKRFTEASDPRLQQEHVTTMLFYRRLLHELASFYSCEPNEEAILATRQRYTSVQITERLLRAANPEALLIDTGFPPPEGLLPHHTLSKLAGCVVKPILRVEVLMQQLIAKHPTLPTVIEALQAALQDVRGQGYVALKSVVAYRTGLAIDTWDARDVKIAFAEVRREVQEKGSVQLRNKPLLDTLLHVTFVEAAQQELPIQFHTGYGDTDADMLLANPLHLRAVLEQRKYRAMPVVLLHECYPYTRLGAYLAAVYDNVYLDLSYGIPFLGFRELLEFTQAAFDVAPFSKLLYSSDGVGTPEIHWISALMARQIFQRVLEERVSDGSLDWTEAEMAGEAVLRNNARELYRL